MTLETEARRLADEIRRQGVRVVLAESCTAGLACAALAAVPGISEFLCGSLVTYRDSAKREWLGVSADELAKYTAVSEPVARWMALGALSHTSEAEWSAAVTGHLGPDAPTELDGVIYVAVGRRCDNDVDVVTIVRAKLVAADRVTRQTEGAAMVLRVLRESIAAGD